jgi:hypothetical protein
MFRIARTHVLLGVRERTCSISFSAAWVIGQEDKAKKSCNTVQVTPHSLEYG